jgi:hypothetical protein
VSTKEASRRSPLHDEWAVKVKTRAGWRCEGCGLDSDTIREHGGQLEAAHILPHSEYPDRRYDVANGKALCTFRNRKHPNGLGNGYGCHNAMSGHWGHSYGTVPIQAEGGRWKPIGVALLGIAGALTYAVLFADWRWSWMLEASWAAAGAMAFLSTKHRHAWAVFDLGSLLWLALVALDALARYYWHVGVGAHPFHTLMLAIVSAYAACLILCHLALRRRWLGRGGRYLLHALVRLARKARRPLRASKLG